MVGAIVVFVVIFSLLVLAHEAGHFWAARRVGIKIDEFGIGFPPRIKSFKRRGVVYSFNWIPFGGFVKLHGESGEDIPDKMAFSSKTPLERIWVIISGVLMNFLVGMVLLMIGFWLRMPPLVTPVEQLVGATNQVESKVVVMKIVENSPAASANLVAGDFILGSGEVIFSTPNDFKDFLTDKAGKQTSFLIGREGEELVVDITPASSTEGVIIGAWIDRSIEKVSYVWWKVPWLAVKEIGMLLLVISQAITGLIYQLFTTATIPADLSGPVGIARITVDLMRLGWMRILQFIIFLSLNLGIINLVPFPGLDGGRLAFVLVEMARGGRKLSTSTENAVNTVGFLLIVLLVLVVTYKDVLKII
ncbi:site-2 protease family protein [Patescibacteria group bacterium]|nr:site-2 protease family protein [Patescibacteria group bacterium]